MVQFDDNIIPLELKAERNLKAKSLTSFIKRYNTKCNIRTSLFNYVEGNLVTDLPLYANSVLEKFFFSD